MNIATLKYMISIEEIKKSQMRQKKCPNATPIRTLVGAVEI
jgi:hypothetical protein